MYIFRRRYLKILFDSFTVRDRALFLVVVSSHTIHQYLSLHNRVDEKYMRAISKDSLCLLAIQKGGVFFLKYEQALCYLKAVNI